MRLVLDTNTAVSGLLWHGTPGKLLDAAQNGDVFLFTSVALLTELQGVLTRSKFAKQLQTSGLNVGDLFDGYAALATVVIPAAIAATILRDSADDAVLATAVAANADIIVSGDNDLLSIKEYRGIRIVTAAEVLANVDGK